MTDRVVISSENKSEEDHASGHRQRLKTRFMHAGREALQDYELLELIPVSYTHLTLPTKA